MRRAPLLSMILGLGAAGLCGVAFWSLAVSPGCSVVESTGDFLADATAGTAVSGALRGAARAAESMKEYSPSQEHYIGRSVAAQILARYRVHPDQRLQDYVNLVGLAVLAAPEPKRTLTGYHFVVLVGDEVQAVSAPGGFVFLTEGTVKKAKDEDELAAVLAHEIAHVSLGHGIGAIKAATRNRSFTLLMQSAGQIAAESTQGSGAQLVDELTGVFTDVVGDITDELLVKGYGRSTELEADAEAAKYLKSSGYAVGALSSYLKMLESVGVGGEGGWGKTHPAPKDRVDELADAGLVSGPTAGHDVRRARFAKALAGA